MNHDLILNASLLVFGTIYSVTSILGETVAPNQKLSLRAITKLGWIAISALLITATLGFLRVYQDAKTIAEQKQVIQNNETTIRTQLGKIENYETTIKNQSEAIQRYEQVSLKNQELILNFQQAANANDKQLLQQQREILLQQTTLLAYQGAGAIGSNPIVGVWRLKSQQGGVVAIINHVVNQIEEGLMNEITYWQFGEDGELTRYKTVNGEKKEVAANGSFGGAYSFDNGTLYINNRPIKHEFKNGRNTLILDYDGGEKELERVVAE